MSLRPLSSVAIPLERRLAAQESVRREFREKGIGASVERAAVGRAPTSAPNLDTRTLNDNQAPCWKVTVLDFGDGLIEGRCVLVDGNLPRRKMGRREGAEERSDSTINRSWRRARTSMRRRLWALRPDRLLTLTKRGKFASIDEAWEAFAKFSRMCSAEFGTRWKFVAVPERHETFGWHIHVALRGLFDVSLLRLFWHRSLGHRGITEVIRGEGSPGNVQISFRHYKKPVRRLAAYLGKYLAKSMSERGMNRKAFSCSRGLVPVSITKWELPVCGGRPVWLVSREIEELWCVETEVFEWKDSRLDGFTVKSKEE